MSRRTAKWDEDDLYAQSYGGQSYTEASSMPASYNAFGPPPVAQGGYSDYEYDEGWFDEAVDGPPKFEEDDDLLFVDEFSPQIDDVVPQIYSCETPNVRNASALVPDAVTVVDAVTAAADARRKVDAEAAKRAAREAAEALARMKALETSRADAPTPQKKPESKPPTPPEPILPETPQSIVSLRRARKDACAAIPPPAPRSFVTETLSPLTLMTAGHVDSGKSTLIGRLLVDSGTVEQTAFRKCERGAAQAGKSSFAYAWVVDQDSDERSRGVTVDVCFQRFTAPGGRPMLLLDCPGHADYVPNLLQRATAPDVGVLVIDASPGAFEAGFSARGQTREHSLLLRALGVKAVVLAVNKLDTYADSETRFKEITSTLLPFLQKTAGFKKSQLSAVPIVALHGTNVFETGGLPWYSGLSLIAECERAGASGDAASIEDRLIVSAGDVYRDNGSVIAGNVLSGAVSEGDVVVLQPEFHAYKVQRLKRNGEKADYALAGDVADITLVPVRGAPAVEEAVVPGTVIVHGCAMLSQSSLIAVTLLTLDLEEPLLKGSQFDCFLGPLRCEATLRKITKTLGRHGSKHARFVPGRSMADVVLKLSASVPLVRSGDAGGAVLGRLVLRSGGSTVAIGSISEVKEK